MVKFGYTIVYVDDVQSTIAFFEIAFGMKRRFIAEGGDYGELDTGETVLAFASHSLGELNLPQGYIKTDIANKPLGVEIALVTDDVTGTHQSAIQHGAVEVKAPEEKPWGQMVSYVRAPFGVLLEICSPI